MGSISGIEGLEDTLLDISESWSGLGALSLADDEIVLPERQNDSHLAIVRLLRIIRYGPPKRTGVPTLLLTQILVFFQSVSTL
jgi:hypothetical protein